MATLKEHQAAMVDLLANGSGIPASASRLAHAMHDVIQEFLGEVPVERLLLAKLRGDATTPGLNDKAISAPVEPIKTDSPAKWPASARGRIKELEHTIGQLKANLTKARATVKQHEATIRSLREPEQAGCRKDDTQVCRHSRTAWAHELGDACETEVCIDCHKVICERPV